MTIFKTCGVCVTQAGCRGKWMNGGAASLPCAERLAHIAGQYASRTTGADAPAKPEAVSLPDDNPKTRFGVAKPPLHLIPAPALAHIATAFRDGAKKYGPYNWREQAVSSTTYVAAALRHIELWLNGEEKAQDSGVHHLAHASACLAILLDAQAVQKLNDDRPPPFNLQALLDTLTTKQEDS